MLWLIWEVCKEWLVGMMTLAVEIEVRARVDLDENERVEEEEEEEQMEEREREEVAIRREFVQRDRMNRVFEDEEGMIIYSDSERGEREKEGG